MVYNEGGLWLIARVRFNGVIAVVNTSSLKYTGFFKIVLKCITSPLGSTLEMAYQINRIFIRIDVIQ